MNNFIKQVIEEKFASKAQQRFFYAKANEKGVPKKEKKKWSKWANEFSDKTDYEKIPNKVEETDIEEIVDEKGNIKRGHIPNDVNTEFTTSKKDSEAAADGGHGAMGAYGSMGSTPGANTALKTLRYWGESDNSNLLGAETMEKDMTYSQALKHFTKKLGLSKEDAVEKLKQLGYIPGQEEIVRLVENPKQYMSDYIESVLVKKTAEEDVISKEDETTEINPLIIKQIESLIKSAKTNNIPLSKIINKLKSE
jgi:hypothetical protein